MKLYGGGPAIVRAKQSIYSQAIEENPIPAARIRSPSPMLAPRGQKLKRGDSNVDYARKGMKKKVGQGTSNKRDLTRLKGSMVEVNSSIIAVDGNLS